MSQLEEINDFVEINFVMAGELIAERRWNFLPATGDLIDLDEKVQGGRYRVISRRFHDRTTGWFAGMGSQEVTIEIAI